VPGCATGEEAYSLAILMHEAMDRLDKHLNIQVFATDIDSDAVEFARAGIYPESIAADVSDKRLKRFFTKVDSTYVVRKQVRESVVFAAQNLIKDPPFSKLDLVSCRNVLIYMDTVLQKQILPLFHYVLNHDAILFLGTSESIGEFADYFSPISTKCINNRPGMGRVLPARSNIIMTISAL
jgi:two-component system CheB/CheR fusion protein